MSSQTPNLNLTLPIGTEKVSRQIINENMTKIDQYCGAINQATYRPIPVTITVNDWVQSGGNWVYNFTTAYITESSDEWFMFSSSLADYAKAHIFAEKKSGGGGAVFTTAIKPTGAISCMIRVFDNDDHKVPVLMEGTVLPYANGGTNASTLDGAKENLGINALSTQITTIDSVTVTLESGISDINSHTHGRKNNKTVILSFCIKPTSATNAYTRFATASEHPPTKNVFFILADEATNKAYPFYINSNGHIVSVCAIPANTVIEGSVAFFI